MHPIKQQMARRSAIRLLEFSLVAAVILTIVGVSLLAADASVGDVYGAVLDPIADIAGSVGR